MNKLANRILATRLGSSDISVTVTITKTKIFDHR